MNAAFAMLARGCSAAEAAAMLAREFQLSRRQAYRYLGEARAVEHPVPLVESSTVLTVKLPVSVIEGIRVYAASRGLTLGQTVSRAVAALMAAPRDHG